MNEKLLRTVVGNLRRVISPNPACGISDAQLLERFRACRDELAFEMLVWRHGSMVLNVCRRVLRDAHEAEDAFQATFLIFVRKLGSIGKRESVGSWLYKVAYRVALRARQRAAVRRTECVADWEQLPGGLAFDDPAQRALWNDLRPVLDEEVNRLPEKYRTPFVLFYLEGMAYPEVAEELGCPKGTVSSRLTTAKGLLRKRLARRGVTLSAALLGGVLAKTATAAVTLGLANSTMQTIRLIAGGPAAGAGTVSAPAVTLAEGVLKAMLMTKVKIVTTLLLAVGVLGFGTSLAIQHTAQAGQPAPASAERPNFKSPAEGPTAPVAAAPRAADNANGITLGRPPAADVPIPTPATGPVGVTVTPLAPPANSTAIWQTTPPVPATKVPPAANESALADRLAKVEARLAQIEAQLGTGSPKAAGSKSADPFGRHPDLPDATPAPKGTAPDPRQSRNHDYEKSRPDLFGPYEAAVENPVSTVSTKQFNVPVKVDSNIQPTIVQIQLFISSDWGQTWKIESALKGTFDSFPVTVPDDGIYWFKVHPVYKIGRTAPPKFDQNTVPELKVRVVTTANAASKDAALAELEAQLKAIQQRIAELKGADAEKPAKPGTKVGY